MYRPLPSNLTIKKSKIDGLGLFAVDVIVKDTNLGISHVKYTNEIFDQGYIRTPLGAFINHSDKPNCIIEDTGDIKHLKTIKDIGINEELTTKYSLYKIGT
jgi:SET domain-containing protein